MNVLPNSVANAQLDLAGCSLPAPKASGELPMGIRTEDLVPVAAGGGPPFDIAVVEPLARPSAAANTPGTCIGLKPDPKRLVRMDPASGRAIPAR